jgi:NAD(P)-dependent dehydrogenase (short-subunit alcohol dehydrogenase family)
VFPPRCRPHFRLRERAPFFLVAALAPKMAARGGGSVINIGSQAGVRVNVVAAGPVYSPIQPREAAEAVGAGTIMARVAQPDEIASMIAFLPRPNLLACAGK